MYVTCHEKETKCTSASLYFVVELEKHYNLPFFNWKKKLMISTSDFIDELA